MERGSVSGYSMQGMNRGGGQYRDTDGLAAGLAVPRGGNARDMDSPTFAGSDGGRGGGTPSDAESRRAREAGLPESSPLVTSLLPTPQFSARAGRRSELDDIDIGTSVLRGRDD